MAISLGMRCKVLYSDNRNPAISSHDIRPRTPSTEQDDLLRARLVEMINMRHELVKLAELIDWKIFDREWIGFFPSHTGRPATPPRRVAVLLYFQHAFAGACR